MISSQSARRASTAAITTTALMLGGLQLSSTALADSTQNDRYQPSASLGKYKVSRYSVKLNVRRDLTGYCGTTTVKGVARKRLTRVGLDFVGNKVRSTSMDGASAKFSRTRSTLWVTPSKPIALGQRFSVRTSFCGAIADIAERMRTKNTKGIDFSQFKRGVQLIGQPARTRYVLPLADHPAQKAPALLSTSTSADQVAVSNGNLVRKSVSGKRRTWVYRSTTPIASQLLQFAIGDLEVARTKLKSGLPLTVVARPQKLKSANKLLVATVPKVIDFLSSYAGEFPLDHYGVYAAPLGGELETQGLTLLSEDAMKPKDFRRGNHIVLAHELAHEWFGNSVGVERWQDLWLSEGHAVFYELLWQTPKTNGAPDAREFEKLLRSYAKPAKSSVEKTGPIALPRASALSAAYAPFGGAAYDGGALTLYALLKAVGPQKFTQIERAWTSEHRHSTGSTEDFIALAARVSGQPEVDGLLRSWLYGKKLPAFPAGPAVVPAPAS